MKKLIYIIFFVIVVSAIPLSSALALVKIENPLKYGTFQDLVSAITNFIFWSGMALAPVMLIISGFLFVISAGDPKRVQTARTLAWYTIIGLVVLISARGLIAVLKSVLGYRG